MDKPKFQTILCDTEESRTLHYRIRYQVYCRQTGFDNPKEFTDGKEIDGHDRHSVHFVVRDPLNSQWMAAMRLVLAGSGRIPLEEFCNVEPLPEKLLDRSNFVEFSRLCVLQSHRRHNRDRSIEFRVVDGGAGGVRVTRPDPRYPEIMLGLINSTFEWARRNDVRYCYFLINRALARTLQRLNLDLKPVGNPIEHRGTRTPYIVDMRDSELRMKQKLSVFRELARQDVHYYHYSQLQNELSDTAMA